MVTIGDWIDKLSSSVCSTELDSEKMQNLLRRLDFPKAIVLSGVVYVDGYGRPESIHSVARMLKQSIGGEKIGSK